MSGILGTLRQAIYMHAAYLEEWKQRIMVCRADGLTVREWCFWNAVSAHILRHFTPLPYLFSALP